MRKQWWDATYKPSATKYRRLASSAVPPQILAGCAEKKVLSTYSSRRYPTGGPGAVIDSLLPSLRHPRVLFLWVTKKKGGIAGSALCDERLQ
jgi:hypothetical protein